MTPEEHAQQVAWLTDQIAGALVQAKISLSGADISASEAHGVLNQAEENAAQLQSLSGNVRHAESPRHALENAQSYAQDVDRKLKGGLVAIAGVRDYLGRSDKAINEGQKLLKKLEDLPPAEPQEDGAEPEVAAGQDKLPTPAQLQTRLHNLDRTVKGVTAGMNRADDRLTTARKNLDPLIMASTYVENQQQTARMVDQTGQTVRGDVAAVRGGLKGLGEGFYNAGQDASKAAMAAAELANAARAGLNPTPRSAQVQPAASSEQDHRHRGESRIQSALRDL